MRAHPYAAADDLAVLAAVDERGPAATLPERQPRADRNTITIEEIERDGRASTTLYEFVVVRHNDWLRSVSGGRIIQGPGWVDARNARTQYDVLNPAVTVTVYVDGIRFGGNTESLRGVLLGNVLLARRLSPSEAQAKYGLDNQAGAIEVFTRRDPSNAARP